MTRRQARKIAKRIDNVKASTCPYTEWQLFRAFSRLHHEWRLRRVETTDERGQRIHHVTEDYFRENRVDSMRIRSRRFRHGKFVPGDSTNVAMQSWVRKTWSPPHS